MNRLFIIILILLTPVLAVVAQSRRVAVTFDDLPMTGNESGMDSRLVTEEMISVNQRLLSILKQEKIPAIGFVNEGKLIVRGATDARTEILRSWLDAGLELGNHTFSHIAIDSSPIEAYKEDVIRGETVTKLLLAERGSKLTYFRHTQLRTGPTDDYRRELSQFLKKRGYIVAPVTIDNQEWIFAAIYTRAKARGDSEMMKRIGSEYVRYMETVFDFFEKLSRETFEREIAQTLLLHANALNAEYLDDLVEVLKRRGYRFVSLAEALKDPVYSLPEVQSRRGLSWIHRWRLFKGLPLKEEPAEPAAIAELFGSYGR